MDTPLASNFPAGHVFHVFVLFHTHSDARGGHEKMHRSYLTVEVFGNYTGTVSSTSSDSDSDIEPFLDGLRGAANGNLKPAVKLRLNYAIALCERKVGSSNQSGRPCGTPPRRIPAHHIPLIQEAVDSRDLEKVLSIAERRGIKVVDHKKILEIIEEIEAAGQDATTRKVHKEARICGMRISRTRIEEIRREHDVVREKSEDPPKEIKNRQMVDAVLVHMQSGFTLLAFLLRNFDSLDGLLPCKGASKHVSIAPNSTDRANVIEFSRLLLKPEFKEPNRIDWDAVIVDLNQLRFGDHLYCYVYCPTGLPKSVETALRSTGAEVGLDVSRDDVLRWMLLPRFVRLGAGYLPSLADTNVHLAKALGENSDRLRYIHEERRIYRALHLRAKLEKALESQGCHLHLGAKKLQRLGKTADLYSKIDRKKTPRAAILLPTPLDLTLFRLAKPPEGEFLEVSFTGAEDLLSQFPVGRLVQQFARARAVEVAFRDKNQQQELINCASFFRPAETPLFGVAFAESQTPDFSRMKPEHRILWSAYVLTLFDGDALLPESALISRLGGRFGKNYHRFLTAGENWIEEWGKQAADRHQNLKQELEAIVMIKCAFASKLSRVWKFGFDEATKRVTRAVAAAADERFFASSHIDRDVAIAKLMECFSGMWPTVYLTKGDLVGRAASHLNWSILRLGGVHFGNVYGSEKGGDSRDDVEQNETLDQLICERLDSPIPEDDESMIHDWWLRLFVVLRRIGESEANIELGKAASIVSKPIQALFGKLARELATTTASEGTGKELHRLLEEFFA